MTSSTIATILSYHNNYYYYGRLGHRYIYNNSTLRVGMPMPRARVPLAVVACVSAATATTETSKAKQENYGGFVGEMRAAAMKLHTRDQAKEGEREAEEPPLDEWEPTIKSYLRFLVDAKVVYDVVELIVREAWCPYYSEFQNTGLERSGKLDCDLEWFRGQGYAIPEPSRPGIAYACYLKELAGKEPHAFVCHLYNIYFAHFAGGRLIGGKVAGKILDGKELEFYKCDDHSQLLQNVREKLNMVAFGWTREEKDRCLEETEKSFNYSGEILRLIFSK